MGIFSRSKPEIENGPELTPAVAERFRRMAYGGDARGVERDALLIEKRAMRREWRWMAEHRPEEYKHRRLELAEEMKEIARELRAVEVVPPPSQIGRAEPVRFGFRVTVPELTPEEIETERTKLMELYRDLVTFPLRYRFELDQYQRIIDAIDVRLITSTARKVRKRSRTCRTLEEIEAELRARNEIESAPEPPINKESETSASS